MLDAILTSDILPAVWLASALSVGVGISACKLFARIWRD